VILAAYFLVLAVVLIFFNRVLTKVTFARTLTYYGIWACLITSIIHAIKSGGTTL
jgi:hypothetical protein